MTRTASLVILAGVVAFACGGADTGEDAPSDGTTTTAASPTTTAAATSADGPEVGTADSALGTILVDGEGRTLYIFTPDDAGSPTCTGDCASSWPPLTGEAAAGAGVDSTLLGSAEHPEAGTMVTYDGWPLYYFAGDSSPGDTNGQGVGGVWYVMGPDGEPITGEAASSAPANGDSDYGYDY